MLQELRKAAEQFNPKPEPRAIGRITRVVGLTVEAVGLRLAVGSRCLITYAGQTSLEAEVVGFSEEKTFLLTLNGQGNIRPGSDVTPLKNNNMVRVGGALLGRTIDALGDALDDLGDIEYNHHVKNEAPLINPMKRQPIHEPLDVGVRSVNGLLSLGKGQRIGLFAGSGVGKSMLLGMMTRFTEADVVVVGLIGERGREVREFIEHNLTDETRNKTIIVASPADDSPLKRVRAANLATRIGEYYRDQGKQVLLLMDSLSRFAQAHREIALAAGEPPAVKGYPASVFSKIPSLVERAGNADQGEGSLTAIYTVLTDGGDTQDPIADAVRAILDGHIVLSRELADQGHYPAIDIEASISRVMTSVVDDSHTKMAMEFKRLLARFSQVKDLISMGAYHSGSDPIADRAITLQPMFQQFLCQAANDGVSFAAAKIQLQQLLAPVEPSQNQLPAEVSRNNVQESA